MRRQHEAMLGRLEGLDRAIVPWRESASASSAEPIRVARLKKNMPGPAALAWRWIGAPRYARFRAAIEGRRWLPALAVPGTLDCRRARAAGGRS